MFRYIGNGDIGCLGMGVLVSLSGSSLVMMILRGPGSWNWVGIGHSWFIVLYSPVLGYGADTGYARIFVSIPSCGGLYWMNFFNDGYGVKVDYLNTSEVVEVYVTSGKFQLVEA